MKTGTVIVGADSHTCTYGALGAFATGIGSTDMAMVLSTGQLWFKVPETIRFNVEGKLKENTSAKDVILNIIGQVGADGATYKSCEFAGETISDMKISDRMVLSNMAIEMGGKTGLIEPDEKTYDYLKDRVSGENKNRLKAFIEKSNLKSDLDSPSLEIMDIDVSELEPQIACPHNVDNVKPASELDDVELDQVFIGSCTNGRIEDLRDAARILKGNEIANDLRMLVIPASKETYLKALDEGLIKIFVEAGALVSAPCCGPCLGGHTGLIGPDEVSLSTSNRNFKGRQGSPEGKVYLSSAKVAAQSAIEGRIAVFTYLQLKWLHSQLLKEELLYLRRNNMKGKVWKFGNDIDTDIILPGRYLIYTDEEKLSEHCMEGLVSDFKSKVNGGDFILGGTNFGCGSSREHAPIAIKGCGISAVIAESFARIFYRNATNVGVPLLEAPGVSALIEDGEEIEVDMEKGLIISESGKEIEFKKLPPFMLEILESGGLINYLKNQKNE